MSQRVIFTALFLFVYPVAFFIKNGFEAYFDKWWQLNLIVFFVLSLVPAICLHILLRRLSLFNGGIFVCFGVFISACAYYKILFVHGHEQGADSALILVLIFQTISFLIILALVHLCELKLSA